MKREAEMIARLLPGSHLLIGEQATKQAVRQTIHSVSLTHFAAHGDAEKGENALAPPNSTERIAHKPDYLLSMGEVSEVRLTAKLVVLKLLSYCVWANKSRRRLWNRSNILRIGCALSVGGSVGHRRQLKATDQFMSHFYESLVKGESASESLHRAMKWMRNNGSSKWRQEAPFVVIGDDVSFDF